jgi:hypothetical protein
MSSDKEEDRNAEEASQEIVAKLRQVDVLASQGQSVAEAIRAIGVKNLEAENARLRRAVSDLTLDKMILAEAARGNY